MFIISIYIYVYMTPRVGLPIEDGRDHVTATYLSWEYYPGKATPYDKESGFNKGLLTTIVL